MSRREIVSARSTLSAWTDVDRATSLSPSGWRASVPYGCVSLLRYPTIGCASESARAPCSLFLLMADTPRSAALANTVPRGFLRIPDGFRVARSLIVGNVTDPRQRDGPQRRS